MQPEDPAVLMHSLAVAASRTVMGEGTRIPSLERDMARLCLLVTIWRLRRVRTVLGAGLAERLTAFAGGNRAV